MVPNLLFCSFHPYGNLAQRNVDIYKFLKITEWILRVGILKSPSLDIVPSVMRLFMDFYALLFSKRQKDWLERITINAYHSGPSFPNDLWLCWWKTSWTLLVLNGHSPCPFEVEDLWEASFSTNPFLFHVRRYFLPLLYRFPKVSPSLDPDSTWFLQLSFYCPE